LQELSVGVQGLFILNALSARLDAEVRTAHGLWHQFTFEQGLLQHEAVRVHAGMAGADIRLVFWPDGTILERGPFDLARTLEQVRSFADSNPEVAIDVTGGHLDAEDAE
jgi:DNA gyrase/topoisomerase IV subunit B